MSYYRLVASSFTINRPRAFARSPSFYPHSHRHPPAKTPEQIFERRGFLLDLSFIDQEEGLQTNAQKIERSLIYAAYLRYHGAELIVGVEDGYYCDPNCPKDAYGGSTSERGNASHYTRARGPRPRDRSRADAARRAGSASPTLFPGHAAAPAVPGPPARLEASGAHRTQFGCGRGLGRVHGAAARRPPRPLPLVAAAALRVGAPRDLPPPLHRPRRRPRVPSGPRAHHQRARGVQAPVGGRAGAGHD